MQARSTLTAASVVLAISAHAGTTIDRGSILACAQVWMPIDTAHADIVNGPSDVKGFAPGQTVPCRYEPLTLGGNSPKFSCRAGSSDSVKVKYGGANGEVYAEFAATRLLWALGFGADRMYPVHVQCSGCPDLIAGTRRTDGTLSVVPALIERKFPAHSPHGMDDGWAWRELDMVRESAGGAPRAHRDALKLLAVFLQHTDSKIPQQRIVCLDEPKGPGCSRPFMLLNDVGLTFGRASRMNGNESSSANLEAWTETPVWQPGPGCTGNLPRSLTGTLENPVISEEGRAFLAGRLQMLTDAQLHDLFAVAHFELRPRDPRDPKSGPATVDEWVGAFKAKRAEIVDKRCS